MLILTHETCFGNRQNNGSAILQEESGFEVVHDCIAIPVSDSHVNKQCMLVSSPSIQYLLLLRYFYRLRPAQTNGNVEPSYFADRWIIRAFCCGSGLWQLSYFLDACQDYVFRCSKPYSTLPASRNPNLLRRS
jgi:hypothetical protein